MYLHASGREDIDVRMLGTGRPFVFEVINPRRALSCETIIKNLIVEGPLVFTSDLLVVDKDYFEKLKDMDNLKQKSYAAVVHSDSVFT